MKQSISQCSDEDSTLFRQSIGAVKRIYTSASTGPKKKVNKTTNHWVKREHAVHDRSTMSKEYWEPSLYETSASIGSEESLFFMQSGVQARTMKQLRNGQYPIDRKIDLHGKTIANAYQLMACVLNEAQADNLRCLEVVHGKGFSSKNNIPVLKNALNQWLRRQPQVLAFCSAPRHRGGTGALMLLIKRKKD